MSSYAKFLSCKPILHLHLPNFISPSPKIFIWNIYIPPKSKILDILYMPCLTFLSAMQYLS